MSRWNPFGCESLTGEQTALAVALVFVIAGITGWVYEELFYRVNDGFFSRRGFGRGPWLPIYGFGMVLLLFATAPVWNASPAADSIGTVCLLCSLISGGFEFLVGWVLYHCCNGLRLWDYNTERWNWGNIGGYVCFRSVLVFALGATVLIFAVVPIIGTLAKALPDWGFAVLCGVPSALCALDIIDGYLIKGRFRKGKNEK